MGYLSKSHSLHGQLALTPSTFIYLTSTISQNQTLPIVLARPVSNSDQLAITRSLSDPAHGAIQELEDTLETLDPAYQEAPTFLESLHRTSSRKTEKLTSLCGRTAAERGKDIARPVANLIHSFYSIAIKICETKIVSTDNSNKKPRPISNKRCTLIKKLGLIKSIQNQLLSPHLNPNDTRKNSVQLNKENEALCKAISEPQALKPDLPLEEQLERLVHFTREAII